MDDTQSHSTPIHSSWQKRTMTFMTKKWQPSSMALNVADHTSLVPTTQSWSEQTIKTSNTSVNHKKSWVDKPDGWSSSKTSITTLTISLATQTPLPISSPDEKTLMRG